MKRCFRKAISAAIVLALSATLLSGCGGTKDQKQTSTAPEKTENPLVNKAGLPIVTKLTTFNVMVAKNPSDKTAWAEKEAIKKAEAETGLKFEWTEVQPTAWKEKVSITLASGTLPDVIIGNMPDLPIFLDSFLPLDNLIQEYAPNLVKIYEKFPEVKVACMQGDGKIYSMPLAQLNGWIAAYALSMNKTWLDKLNLKIPETADELYQALKAIKDGDPNGNGKKDEIPLGYFLDNSTTSIPHFYPLLWNFGICNDGIGTDAQYVMAENGKILFIGADKRFYEFLKYMNKLNKEGLIDPDGFVQKYQDYLTKGQKGLYGMLSHQTYDDIIVGLNNSKDYVPLVPMKDASGKRTTVSLKVPGDLIPNTFKITKSCKNPEAMVRFYDYVNSTLEGKLLWSFGPENVVYKKADNGKLDKITKMPEGFNSFAELRQTKSPGMSGFWFLTPDEMANFNVSDPRDQKLVARIDFYKPYFKKELIPFGQDTAEATKSRAVMFNEINTYMMNFIAESILKDIDDARWNAHLEKLKKLSTDQFVKDYQTYYDRSIAAMNKK